MHINADYFLRVQNITPHKKTTIALPAENDKNPK